MISENLGPWNTDDKNLKSSSTYKIVRTTTVAAADATAAAASQCIVFLHFYT